jgi:proteasome lid subunit RPN8/RPN11
MGRQRSLFRRLDCDLIFILNRVGEISEQTGPAANLKTWHVPQCPFLMECSSTVLGQIRQEVEAASNSRRGEREIGGVLFGTLASGHIRILAAKPIQCEHAMGPGFVLSEKDETRLTQLISNSTSDPKLNGLETLGWYHSHIRSRIFLSERDVAIHFRHFAAPYQVALVVHPESARPIRAGFFFREASGEMRTESSYEEFTIETPTLAAPEPPRPAAPSKPAPSHHRTPAKPEQQQAEALICRKCGSKHLRRSRRTGSIERLRGVFGFHPYRCHECLSRSFLKTSPDLFELARSGRRKRPEERKRARQRTRREVLLWGGGILGFLAILYYMIRDTGPKPDAP